MEDYKKKYEEAVERLRNAFYSNNSRMCDEYRKAVIRIIEPILPELKESEDEKMRKQILSFLKEFEHDYYRNLDFSSWIAWVEKQGEQKPAWSEKHIADVFEKVGLAKIVREQGNDDLMNALQMAMIELAKQGEQKPTDKVEPKFKVGDVIKNIDNGDTVKIEQILDNYYCYSGWDGAATIHSDFTISEQDNWELVEKKPSDKVEPKFKVGDWIINSEGMLRHIMYVDKSGYQTDNGWLSHDFYEKSFHLWTIKDAKDGDVLANNGNIILFKEISNSARKDYRYIKSHCLALIHTFDFYTGGSYNLDDEFHPATKEQQDLLFKKMKEAGYEWDVEKKELKKIEQKPVWSEEDEKYFNVIYKELESYIAIKGYYTPLSCADLSWLKSLKERYTWKPSEEQIKLLREVQQALLGKDCHNRFVNFMYELKRLREE